MAKFLCKECKLGIVTRIKGSEVERGWCKITKQYQVGAVEACSAFEPKKVPKEKKGKQ